MAKNVINRGSTANDGTGDNLRLGAEKINSNFSEIYTALGDGTNISGIVKIADDSSTVTSISANGETLKILGGTGITSTISGNNLTLAVDGTIITGPSTTTLTNKTINGPDNTLTNIANGSLSNSTITLTGDSGSTAIDLGDTLTVSGTTNQITTAQSGDTLTLSLPSAITVPGNLTVTGNFNVLGTQSVIDSNTIEITNSFTFEGTTSDDHETVLTVENPTADRTVTIPNATGTIVLKDTTDTLTNKTLSNASITGATGTINLTSQENKIRFNYNGTSNFPSSSDYEGMFAYDYSGNNPYVADTGGWTKIITENASVGDLSNVNISGVADGNGLIWSSAQGRFNAGSLPSTGFSIAMAVAL